MNGPINITLPALETSPPSPTESYLLAARELFKGVSILCNNSHNAEKACAFLAAQALECVLKSYLSFSGVEERELKKQSIRHNLEDLWRMAEKKGLKIDIAIPNWCKILNSVHDKPYYLRYPMGLNAINIPELDKMESDLKKVIITVEEAVGS